MSDFLAGLLFGIVAVSAILFVFYIEPKFICVDPEKFVIISKDSGVFVFEGE